MSSEDYAYIGRKPECGCVVAAVMDGGPHGKVARETVARWVSDMITDGLNIERVTNDYVRANLRECQHGQQELPLFAAERAGAGTL